MSVPKPKRIKSEANLNQMRWLSCSACGARPPSDPHHLKTVKSGGSDELENLISLCRVCHVRCHSMGTNRFVALHKEHILEHRRKNGLPKIILP